MIKSVVAAAVLVLLISGIAIYVLPQYIYISPFSKFYDSGVVEHKSIGHSTDNDGNQITTYTVSVSLINDDPINHVSGGETLAYIVTKVEWDMLVPMDFVKIALLPDAHAQVVGIIPGFGSTPQWRVLPNPILPLNLTLTADKQNYTIGETANFTIGDIANFTVRLTNDPTLSDGGPCNVSLFLFKNCIYYIFKGQLVNSNDDALRYNDPVEIQNVSVEPNQEVNYSFSWDLTGIQPGGYAILVYIGYLPPIESPALTLTQTILIDVSK